jgi:hypothetical protein
MPEGDVQKERPNKPDYSSLSLVALVRHKDSATNAEIIAAIGVKLREGASVNERDPIWGYTPAMHALKEKNLPAAVCIIRDGHADVLAKDGDDEPTISKAARAGGDFVGLVIEQMKLLGEKCDIPKAVNEPDKDGFTAIMNASMEGKEDSIDVLLENGGDFRLQNLNGNAATHLAATWGHIGLVCKFWELGADLGVKNNHRQDVADVAEANGFKSGAKEIRLMMVERRP